MHCGSETEEDLQKLCHFPNTYGQSTVAQVKQVTQKLATYYGRTGGQDVGFL